MLAEFMDIFLLNCEECIPHYEVTIRPKDKPYITTEIRRLIRQRDRLHFIHKRNPTNANLTSYRNARNRVVSAIRRSIRVHEQNEIEILSNQKFQNPKL